MSRNAHSKSGVNLRDIQKTNKNEKFPKIASLLNESIVIKWTLFLVIYHMMNSLWNSILSFEVHPGWKMHNFILREKIISQYEEQTWR